MLRINTQLYKYSVQSLELDCPIPSPARECVAPSAFGSKGEDTLPRGGGGDPMPTKGQTLWYSMYTIIPRHRNARGWCLFQRFSFPEIRQIDKKEGEKQKLNGKMERSL